MLRGEVIAADDFYTQPSQRAWLQRQAQLQEFMARLMGERLLEHQHRLSSLRLRLTLLNTPKQVGPPCPPPARPRVVRAAAAQPPQLPAPRQCHACRVPLPATPTAFAPARSAAGMLPASACVHGGCI